MHAVRVRVSTHAAACVCVCMHIYISVHACVCEYVSLTVRVKVTRQSPQITSFEETGEPRWNQTRSFCSPLLVRYGALLLSTLFYKNCTFQCHVAEQAFNGLSTELSINLHLWSNKLLIKNTGWHLKNIPHLYLNVLGLIARPNQLTST